MRYHGLVGMAAPQIGINQRIFVSEIRRTKTRKQQETDPVRVFINPKITNFSRGQEAGYEGCGSVAYAGLFGSVRRARIDSGQGVRRKREKVRAARARIACEDNST